MHNMPEAIVDDDGAFQCPCIAVEISITSGDGDFDNDVVNKWPYVIS